MNEKQFNFQVPANLHERLQRLANEKQTDPVNIITQLVTEAEQRKYWLQDLRVLRQQIENEKESQVESTKENIIAQLRQTRQEIFEAEYAHLYR